MGHVIQNVRLGALKEAEVPLLVDTGATYSLITPALADRLGVVRLPNKAQVTLANGQRITAEIGAVQVQIGDRVAPSLAIIADCDEMLLGVEALEALGLAVDPTSRTLTPTRGYTLRLGGLRANPA